MNQIRLLYKERWRGTRGSGDGEEILRDPDTSSESQTYARMEESQSVHTYPGWSGERTGRRRKNVSKVPFDQSHKTISQPYNISERKVLLGRKMLFFAFRPSGLTHYIGHIGPFSNVHSSPFVRLSLLVLYLRNVLWTRFHFYTCVLILNLLKFIIF